jgi:hypothetical protein
MRYSSQLASLPQVFGGGGVSTHTHLNLHLFRKCLEGAVEQEWVEQVLEVEEQAHVGRKQPLK